MEKDGTDGDGVAAPTGVECGCVWMDGWVGGGGVTQAKGVDAVAGREIDFCPTLCAVDALLIVISYRNRRQCRIHTLRAIQ